MKRILVFVIAIGFLYFEGTAQGVFERVSRVGEPDSVIFMAKAVSVEKSTYEGAWTSALMQAVEQSLQGITPDDVATSLKADNFQKTADVKARVFIMVEKTPQGTFRAICTIDGEGIEENYSVIGSKEQSKE